MDALSRSVTSDAVAHARREAKQTGRWLLTQALPTALLRRHARRNNLLAQLIIGGPREDPAPILTALRDGGDLVQIPFGWATASHHVVREVLRREDMLVGPFEQVGPLARLLHRVEDHTAIGPAEPPSMLVSNAPEHTRYRRLVSKVFTAKAVGLLEDRTESIAARLLDELGEQPGIVDLVPRYAAQLPVTVICEILGVPLDNRGLLLRLGEGAAASLDTGLSWSRYRLVQSSLREFNTWIGGHLETLRANPGTDLLSQLVVADGDGEALTEVELRSLAGLLLVAGFETTVNIIGSGTDLLLSNPDQRDVLSQHPELWGNAVDEALRVRPPVYATSRYCTEDTEVAGHALRAGQPVVCLIVGANRDPRVFSRPGDFDVTRENARDHMSFSAGRHFCLGAALARMEATVALRALFARYPELSSAGKPVARQTRALQGPMALPVRLGRQPASVGSRPPSGDRS